MLTCTFEDQKTAHLRHVTVDALIEKAGQILLIKRSSAYFIEPGKFALPGGYLDRGESAAQGVVREVLEETGYQAQNVTLFRIVDQPRLKGDDRQNVGFFFMVTVGSQIQKPDYEVASLHWFPFTRLPPSHTIAFDHAENLSLFLKYLKQPIPLPILN